MGLKSREVAAAAIAYPPWQEIIRGPSFVKKFLTKFDGITFRDVQKFKDRLANCNFKYEQYCNVFIEQHYILLSGHCCLCLMYPFLLCKSDGKCLCLDHRILWGDIDTVLWDCYFLTADYSNWPEWLFSDFE